MSEKVGARRRWTKEDDDIVHRCEKEESIRKTDKEISSEEANEKTM